MNENELTLLLRKVNDGSFTLEDIEQLLEQLNSNQQSDLVNHFEEILKPSNHPDRKPLTSDDIQNIADQILKKTANP